MRGEDIHFEVFVKRSRKDEWKLLGAFPEKVAAMEAAQNAVVANPAGSVRVTKEKFNAESREFHAFTIFEHGADKFADDGRADRTSALPCSGPADLVTAHARHTIGRALKNWLDRKSATVLELLHRVDLVEELEATGTEMQHAVQKVAVAQAQSSDSNVQHFVKQINQLVQQAVEKLYTEVRADSFPTLKKGELAATVGKIAKSPDRERKLRGAVAGRLKSSKDWKAKFQRLLDLADEAHSIKDTMPWAINVIGEFIGEVSAVSAARQVLMQTPNDLGDELDALTDIFCACSPATAALSAPGERLAWYFGEDLFGEARATFAEAILKELRGPKRLRPSNLESELELNRTLADRLVVNSRGLIDPANIAEAFVMRSSRLLEPEAVEKLLESAEHPGEEIERLIRLEDHIVGDANKRKLASYIRAQCGTHGAETHFLFGSDAPVRRLSALCRLRKALDGADFDKADHTAIAERFELIAVAIEEREKVFQQVEKRAVSALEKAYTLLRMAALDVLPPGKLVDDAVMRAKRQLASAEAREAIASDPEARKRAAEIAKLLGALKPKEKEDAAAA